MNLETKDIIKEEIEHKIKSCSNEIQDYLEIELNKSKETLLNQWLEITRLNNKIDEAIRILNSAKNHYDNDKTNWAIERTLRILKGSDDDGRV